MQYQWSSSTALRAPKLSSRQHCRRLQVTAAAAKQDLLTWDALRPATVTCTAVICITSLISTAAPLSVEVACTATAIATAQQQQQQQPTQESAAADSKQQQQQPAQEPAAADNEQQELQLQLKRQADKIQSLATNNQRLEQQLRQERKGSRKGDRLKDQLAASQAEAQQLAGQLQIAQFELLLLQQQQAAAQDQVSTTGQSSHKQQGGSRPAPAAATTADVQQPQQQQQQQQASNESSKAQDAAPRKVVAFVGGRALKPSDRKTLPPDAEVRFFGSPRDTGRGELQRLEAAIKAGTIDEVYMPTRWNSHTTTQLVTRLCKDRGIPVLLLDAGEKARRKAEWQDANSSSSDMDTA
ncbi:hypothetical protein OEZ85_005284 [Tetradesmus obliquus]|uniref:DUF2325 domain-containing protein n=1 Tax=Tetradesmus obliquus TaxID=3088 RepID=A0ABY8UIS4_TETOB|nr:hypothetical protein OEZ85_005284 [Tetradesmus obliquus]